jgi:protein SCO1
LNRDRAIRATVHAALVLLLVVAAAQGAERLRLPEWPPRAPKPDFQLVDVNHARRSLADYRGRVSIVFFGFTHCPDVCPNELFKLAQVVRRLGPLASRVEVLFISLDPERDAPKLLKAYVTAFDPRFIALTGSSAQINDVANSFSVQFAKVGQGENYTIDHSTGTYVVDKTGRLRLVATLQTSVDDLVHDLKILASE